MTSYDIVCRPPAGCIERGRYYDPRGKAPLANTRTYVTSAEACLHVCQRTPKCAFFSYAANSQTCDLSTGDAVPKTDSSNWWISGPVGCMVGAGLSFNEGSSLGGR